MRRGVAGASASASASACASASASVRGSAGETKARPGHYPIMSALLIPFPYLKCHNNLTPGKLSLSFEKLKHKTQKYFIILKHKCENKNAKTRMLKYQSENVS